MDMTAADEGLMTDEGQRASSLGSTLPHFSLPGPAAVIPAPWFLLFLGNIYSGLFFLLSLLLPHLSKQ